MILFVRAREHVIAVEPQRQVIFGLGIHIVPGRQTLVLESPSAHLHVLLTVLFFMWKNKTSYLEISSYYCLHRIYFHSSLLHVPLDRLEHVCGLLIYIFLFLRHVSLCLCPLLTVIFAWRFEHTWIVNARFSSNVLRWICTNHFSTSPFIYYYWKPWMCSRVYSGTIAERVLLRISAC